MALVACLATAPAADAARPAINGGPTVNSPSEAPWSVLTDEDNGVDGTGFEGTGCSGTIIDSTHVITAAHCTYNAANQPWSGSNYHVFAGIVSNKGGSELQERTVSSIRVAPGYVPPIGGADDVAVLTLNSALDLSKPGVKSIPVAGENYPLLPGTAVNIAGWGQTSEGVEDGNEHSLGESVIRQRDCLGGAASVLCANTPVGATCHGDSGSGIVSGSPPVLVGVTSVGVGAQICIPLSPTGFVYLGSPEISQWLRGNNAPPLAPRATTSAAISSLARVGQKVSCEGPAWTYATNINWVFFRADTDQDLQVGPSSTFVPKKALLNLPIACASIAGSAGGVTESLRSGNVTVTPGPPHRKKKGKHPKRLSRQLIKVRGLVHKHGHWKVTLQPKGLLVGGKLDYEWKASNCPRGCNFFKRIGIRKEFSIASPPLGKKTKAELILSLPKVVYGHQKWAASHLVIKVP